MPPITTQNSTTTDPVTGNYINNGALGTTGSLAGTMTKAQTPYPSAVVSTAPAAQQTQVNQEQLNQIQAGLKSVADNLALLKLKGYTDIGQVPQGVNLADLPNFTPPKTPPTDATKAAVDAAIAKEAGVTPPVDSPEVIQAQADRDATLSQLNSLGAQMDARAAAMIEAIKQEYDGLIQQQIQTNKAYEGGVTTEGFVSGRARYAPTINLGNIQAAVNAGIQKLSALQAKKAGLIAEAENARSEKQYKLLNDKLQLYRDTIKEERAAAQQMYENTLKASQEARAQAQEERDISKDQISQTTTIAEGIAGNYSLMVAQDGQEAADAYIAEVADNLGLPRAFLASNVQKTLVSRRATEKTAVLDLGKKYVDADINPEDSFAVAAEKARRSETYQNDIMKGELDLVDLKSRIENRTADSNINYADPIFKIYSDATGSLVSSPTTARAVQGYAQSLLAGKEIVADDVPEVKEGQIKSSEAVKLLSDSFTKFKGPKVTEAEVFKWLSTPEAIAMEDEDKAQYIRSNFGMNPDDFLY